MLLKLPLPEIYSAAQEGAVKRREFLEYTGIASFLLASGSFVLEKLLPDAPFQTSTPDVAQAIEKAIKAGFGEGFRLLSFKDSDRQIHAEIEHLENRYTVASGDLLEWKIIASSVS